MFGFRFGVWGGWAWMRNAPVQILDWLAGDSRLQDWATCCWFFQLPPIPHRAICFNVVHPLSAHSLSPKRLDKAGKDPFLGLHKAVRFWPSLTNGFGEIVVQNR